MDSLSLTLYSFASGIPYVLSHFFLACFILSLGLFLYVKTTKIDEFALIREGNLCASLSVGGTLISLSLPLSSSLQASLSLPEIFIWGFTAIVLQLFCERVVRIFTGDINSTIIEERHSPVITLACCKFCVALLNSAVIAG
jgi:putative membrane protein